MCGGWWKWRGKRERVYENGVEGAWGGCGVVCKWNGSTVYCVMVFKCECEGVWNVRVCTLWSSICIRMCWLFENLPHDTSHTSSSFKLVSIATTAWASLTAEEAPSKRGERDCR